MKLAQLFRQTRPTKKEPKKEHGYAMMVGLMATLTISIIGLNAAAPQVAFDSQREREEELLWRGAQVAQALLSYRSARGGQLPTTLEELVEGVNTGVKKIRFLRPHALCDPLLPCTPGKSNWRLVHPGDPVISEMMQNLQAYMQKKQDNPQLVSMINVSIQNLSQFAPQVNLAGVGLGSQTGVQSPSLLNPNQGDPNAPQNESAFGSKPEKGPIVGVVSRSKDKMIRAMLDIEQYDKGLFFAGGVVIAGGFITPFFGNNNQQQVNPVTRCANGGIWFPDPSRPGGGGCFGGVPPVDRDKNKTPQ